MKTNKHIAIIIIMLLNSVVAVSQNATSEKTIVTDFVKAIFWEKNTAKSIADKYIYFEPISNTTYSIDDRIKILSKHLKKIKKEKSPLLDSKDFYVARYDDYKGNKVLFLKATEKIFILVSKNSPVMYFSLMNQRIFSFDYILKGEEGLFITY